MKPAHDPANKNCSCATCMYKSEAENASFRRLVAGGSRIDKLYFGKYIPLRERKLLDKLVRTRAVYDDIRNQLLSESESSMKEKPNLKPRKHKPRTRELKGKKTSAIFEIVDMVDKGNVSGPASSSECCNCCVCGSKTIHDHHEEPRKHKHGRGRIAADAMSKTSSVVKRKMANARRGVANRGRSYAQRMSRTSTMMRQLRESKMAYPRRGIANSLSRTSVMMKQKMGDARRNVRIKAKSIMSDPCTCTTTISKDMKRRLQDAARRMRPQVQLGEQTMFEGLLSKKLSVAREPSEEVHIVKQVRRGGKIVRESIHMKKSNPNLIGGVGEGVKRLKESKKKIKQNVEAATRKSLEKIKNVKEKVDGNIAAVKRSVENVEFPIKKDSIVKFKEKLRSRKPSRGYACRHKCVQGECDPRECIKIKRQRRASKEKQDRSSVSDMSVQASTTEPEKARQVLAKAGTDRVRQKPGVVTAGKHKQHKKGASSTEPRISIDIGTKSLSLEVRKNKAQTGTRTAQSRIKTQEQTSGTKKDHVKPRSSQTKLKQTKKPQTGSHALKRCFCTLKLKGKGSRPKPSTSITTGTQSETQIKHNKAQLNAKKGKHKKRHLLPYECEPGICVPGECDPYACLELINKREMTANDKYSNTDMGRLNAKRSNTDNRRTKSTSSFTSKSKPSKVKKIQSSVGTSERKRKEKRGTDKPIPMTKSSPDRQVVRISSSFSFNVEFYKEKSSAHPEVADNLLRPSSESRGTSKEKHNKDRGHQDRKMKKHQNSTSVLVKKRNRGSFIAPMKRCFCTLTLQTKERKEIKNIESIGTETPIENLVDYDKVLVTKGTKTKQDKRKHGHALEPYECEPGICVPGQCDPYKCLERIKLRQLKDMGTATNKAKMKSATSITKKGRFRSKSASTRSKLKGQTVSTIRQKTKAVPPAYQEVVQKPQRQAVRIGSTFSFDIVFHKDKPQRILVKNDNRSEISNQSVTPKKPKIKVKNRGARPRDSSSLSQDSQASISNANKAVRIRPMLKRCFCTLKLQGNQNKIVKNKPPNVIAVSRVTVTETKIKSHKNIFIEKLPKLEQRLALPREKSRIENWATLYKSSSGTISKTSVVFRYKEMQSYFRKSNLDSMTSNKSSKIILNNAVRSVFAQSNYILPTFYAKVNEKIAYSENCIIRCSSNEKRYINKQSFNKYRRTYLKSQKSGSFSEPQPNYPSISQVKRQHFYTMNVHIPEGTTKHKLKPYECEPGVCVPYECDPYQCQKLIMKRLMKKVSRTAGTNFKSKSMSSSSPQSASSSKKLQSRQPHKKVKNVPARGITIKTIPNRAHKQAVRVGSSFSFNVEFSKDRTAAVPAPVKEYVPPPKVKAHKPTKPPRKKIREQGIMGHNMKHRNEDSQSGIETANKGSGMKPMMQRCFCTLKLQKKGKNRIVQHQQAFNRGTATPPNTMNELISSKTMMNTGQNTGRKLLPYECEPLVCVPGECDPYECLERIKKRNKRHKDSGTGAMQHNMSTGSMTGAKQYRTQGKQVQSKLRHKQTKPKAITETRPSLVEYKGKPSKQAVRIGSSFSFNVEFFKENSQSRPTAEKQVHRVPRPVRPSAERVVKERASPSPSRKKFKETGSQDLKFVHHRDSQSGSGANVPKSTMTPTLLQRCFCTKKLHEKHKQTAKVRQVQSKGSQAKNKKPFLIRCLCAIKKLKGTKQPNVSTERPPIVYADTGTATKNEQKEKKEKTFTRIVKVPDFKPYECQPGICVPGECNPYECEKLIKARNLKLQTRESITDKARTRSTSSNYSSQTSKAKRTQSNFKTTSSTTKPRSRPPNAVKKVQPVVQRLSSDRQVVRIGSNFSVSVEFYKDRIPNTEEVQAAAKAIRYKPPPKPKNKPVKTVKTGKRDHKTQDRAAMGSNQTIDQETQANKTKMQDRGSGIGPILKRCFCTLKLQKGNKPEVKLATQATETMREEPTHQTRAVGTGKHWTLKPYECEPGVCVPYQCDPYECEKLIKKRLLKETAVMTTGHEKQLGHKLLPFECEPRVCIPGQCDPYECAKRIKLRNQTHRHSGTSTYRYRGKSVSSNIRSTTSSKGRRVQYKKRGRRTKRSQSVSSKPPIERPISRKSLDRSTKQSVRIGSGFSFDVEFYKNKSHTNSNLKIQPIKQTYHHPKVKPTRSTTSSAITRSPGTKTMKMQYRRPVRETSSQMLAQKIRNTGVNPFLKRCFCTLKLQKSGDMPSNHTAIGRAARDRSVYLTTLLPYECEPGVCIPGECDPYECQKRIQRRLMRSQHTGTGRTSQDSSTSSTRGTRYKSTTCQPLCPGRSSRQKGTYAKPVQERQVRYEAPKPVESCSASRQAIRMGSSFNFDIEFFKDSSSKEESEIRDVCPPPCRPKMHSIITKPKHKRTRSKSVTSSDIRRQNGQIQAGSRTESKSTGFGPRLKRCFCTLALNKKSPPEMKTQATFRNDDLSDLYSFSRNVGVGTKGKYAHLKPYECEPGVCVPGSCDPYECYERIKRRMRDSGTAIVGPSKRYASSITSSYGKNKCANTQCRGRKERPTMANIKEVERVLRSSGVTKVSGQNARQAVRLGSSFSFSMEFYKDRPTVKIPKNVYKVQDVESRPSRPPKIRRASKLNKDSSAQQNYRHSSAYAGRSGNDQKCQSECVKNTTRGTNMGAFLRRCFCTLNLHKNAGRHSPNVAKPPSPPKEKPPELHRTAVVQTHDKHYKEDKIQPLKPYECEPNVCIPGECDPYECYERIKRRNLRRQNRKTSTNRRSSQVSVGSMASRLVPCTSRRMQSGDRRARCSTRPCQVCNIVEEPRFAHVFEDIRTGVKIGSNVSFNMEFYKEKSQPTAQICKTKICADDCKPVKQVKRRDVPRKSTFSESRPTGVHRGIGGKSDNRTCESQASGAPMVDRGVNSRLRRCFCTMKLMKNQPNAVTVNRLAIENVNPFKQKKKSEEKYLKPKRPKAKNNLNLRKNLKKDSIPLYKNKHLNRKKRDYYINDYSNPNHEYSEMTTIYPYIPNKYNKHSSNTFLLRNNNIPSTKKCRLLDKHNATKISTRKDKQQSKPGKCARKLLITEKKGSRKGKIHNAHPSRVQNIKMFMHRIFPIFFTNNLTTKTSKKVIKKSSAGSKKTRKKRNDKISKQDALKTSKSDRRPRPKGFAPPKKTISLKVAKAPENKRRNRDNVYYNQTKPKKYSRYQSGDYGQIEPSVFRHHAQKPVFPNNICCAYCEVLRDTKQFSARSPCDNTKMALTKDKKPNTQNKSALNTATKNINRRLLSLWEKLTIQIGNILELHKCVCEQSSPCPCPKKVNEEQKKKEISKNNKTAAGDAPGKDEKIVKSQNVKKDKVPKTKENAAVPEMANLVSKKDNTGKTITVKVEPKKKCICGSEVCDFETKKVKAQRKRAVKYEKPCICGSKPCARASKAQSKLQARTKREKQLERLRVEKNMKEMLAREKKKKEEQENLRKRFRAEDEHRKKARIKENKLQEKRLKKFKKTSDGELAAESLLDVLRLGVTASLDVIRSMQRAILHPKHTAQNIKDMYHNPSRAFSAMGSAIVNSGAGSTIKRVKTRCGAMRRVQNAKICLETNAVTRHFVIMLSKDPKKRMRARAKRMKRRKEPVDFECSLFMASLRKRPCLPVYYSCPWFYPHCLSMLNLWKQFTDIMLFLVAVTVWSPCILMMEIMRAITCCIFCTGG